MLNLLILISLVLLFYKTLVFLVSLILKRSDIADVSWGLSFIVITLSAIFISGKLSIEALIVTILVFIWGLRLAIRIYRRNKNKNEDFRYQEFKKKFNEKPLQIYIKIFIFQGLLSLLVSLPLISIIFYPVKFLSILEYIGFCVWMIGFIFEVIGDAQLDNFKKRSKEKDEVLSTGLWRYSRHPNYFGEITLWWGIFLISLNNGSPFLNIIGPLTITFLITKVSGIPMLEKRYIGNKEYEDYKRKTSVLIPLPPKT